MERLYRAYRHQDNNLLHADQSRQSHRMLRKDNMDRDRWTGGGVQGRGGGAKRLGLSGLSPPFTFFLGLTSIVSPSSAWPHPAVSHSATHLRLLVPSFRSRRLWPIRNQSNFQGSTSVNVHQGSEGRSHHSVTSAPTTTPVLTPRIDVVQETYKNQSHE